MRRLLAKHRTEMVYAGQARESVNELRLLPRSHARQTVELAHIVVTPSTSVYLHRDVVRQRGRLAPARSCRTSACRRVARPRDGRRERADR